ncbi:MAG: DinB family protein [Planctomycetota bacterium]|nr:DinB family protein [Planctomycetota bacterium]
MSADAVEKHANEVLHPPAGPVLERFRLGGPLLLYATEGLSAEHAAARPGPGLWSIAELVAHLVDADLVHAERMKRIIVEDNPTLHNFDETAWVERLGSHALPITEGAALFAANRAYMATLMSMRPASDYARSGAHSLYGRKTLADELATLVNHLDYHLRFLYGKRANLGVAVIPRYAAD